MGDEARPIGQLLDTLGVEATLDRGDLPSAAVVLLKVIDADGNVSLSVAWSDGMSWLERIGMLAHTLHVEQAGIDPEA